VIVDLETISTWRTVKMNLEGKIVFIAGAITGIADYKQIFAVAEQRLQEQDSIVLNPAVLPWGMEWEAYLQITKEMVRCADAIYVLQNWENSRGVREELALAEQLGKEIIYEPREVVIV
jgi:phage protein